MKKESQGYMYSVYNVKTLHFFEVKNQGITNLSKSIIENLIDKSIKWYNWIRID